MRNIGDKVMIRKDLSKDKTYVAWSDNGYEYMVCLKTMEAFRGDVATITKVYPDVGIYKIDLTDCCYWCDEMFEDKIPSMNRYAVKGGIHYEI